jgi:subtilisin family serine protease
VAANFSKPAVANLSLGGPASLALNNAVTNLFNAGVFVAVAAGNSNVDACGVSPAGATNATTAAASDINDVRAAFSNWGACVDLYAPGVQVPTVGINQTPILVSGTSISSPHVAGTGALVMASFGNASPVFTRNWIIGNATPNVIIGNPAGTPNRLLFKAAL